MRFGSLFAGIGGIDLGFEHAGMECSWQVEINPFCRNVLANHWPEVKQHGDIREVGESNLESVDLICGGFPCQDISYAGKGAGLSGKRSGLWGEMLRTIRMVRPRFALVENVAALLRRGMGRVLGDLAESGYDTEWDCLPAAAFGAPHRRDRVFIVAYAQGKDDGRSIRETSKGQIQQFGKRFVKTDVPNSNEQHDDGRGYGAGKIFGGRSAKASIRSLPEWPPEPDVGRVANGVPARVDRLRCLGNAVVPQVAEWIGKRIIEGGNHENQS